MNLIEVYIQEVTRRLPEKMRTDIARELRSTIEDMLPANFDEKNVKTVLNQLGNPATLASGYKDQPMHLIGPRYFDLYITLLKMILPIAVLIAFITTMTQYFVSYNGEDDALINVIFILIGKGIGLIIEVGIQVFFWLTITFVIIERVDHDKNPQPLTFNYEKWTADDLKNVVYIPKKKTVTKLEVFSGLIWTAIWATVYFNANQLLGVYEGDGARLEFIMPALNQKVLLQYWPIVVLIIGMEITLIFYKFMKQQWTKGMALCNLFLQTFITIIFIVILTNPNLINESFMVYITDLSDITKDQLKMWIVGGVICIFTLGAATNVYDGIKRARVR